MKGLHIGLFTTTGRRSGVARTTPLAVFEDGLNYVVIASAGGSEKHPEWYLNLQANPEVSVQLGGKSHARIAGTASGDERERIWNGIISNQPRFAEYQKNISRVIPVVILRPLTDTAS